MDGYRDINEAMSGDADSRLINSLLPFYHAHPLLCVSVQHNLMKLAHENIFTTNLGLFRESHLL